MNQKKIALFLCRCGANIAGAVDLDTVAARFKDKSGIALIATHDLLCSPAGKKFVEETIAGKKPDGIVIAACSPKMHEKTFRDVAGRAGMNLAQVTMANIREQGAWVTPDKNEATQKAIALISAALGRGALHENLEARSMECNTDVVVIGGGVAGIEAALMAANAGRKVTIIEKDISLGGAVIKTEEVGPSMECAPCLLAPRLAAVRDNPNIRVVSNAEVTDVLGFFGNFTVRVKKAARYVKDSCIGCEACFEVCPVSAPNAFHLGLGAKKAIYTQFPGSVPAAAVINRAICKHFTDGSCDACVAACPFGAIDFNDGDESLEFTAGAVIVATGFANVNPSSIPALGYGTLENVVTMPEFERMASSNGPLSGEIKLKNGTAPASIAVVHCAASLSEHGAAYCSGVCCMTAVKAGELARKKIPGVTVVNIHDRLVFEGPAAQEFYREQQSKGTIFCKTSDLAHVAVTRAGDKLAVSAPGTAPVTVDMVVLSTGMGPSPGSNVMADILDADCDAAGFFKPDHAILHPTGSTIDGIYAAGSCASPCDVPTAITRAQAAAGDALAKLVPGRKIELEIMTGAIDEDKCAGCRLCIAVCPYKAITYDAQKNKSIVNEIICRGCGTCAATCPGGAAGAKHFTNAQIYAELGGVIHG
ncbi:MAG: CoB--CoM heterodisulfide reductase iron-sulfur subunit A family protein [Chitinivibrionales bacterium]|nr:CoB--CoM heterodisulfide reductase iron-sulfur subunit A family protein [Chitinivibrionales bacterium]